MKTKTVILTVLFLVVLAYSAIASDLQKKHSPDLKTVEPKEILSTTRHIIETENIKLKYSATAGQLMLRDEKGEQKAKIFFISYTRQKKTDFKRPVTFVFNGGPGSSSVWLHFGAIGPKVVRLKEDGTPFAPPASLTDNEYTWLRFTDIVFIDPVGTGYSSAPNDKKAKQFYGFKNDIESVGDFIRLYLTRYNRWLSPKFIVGESYGTARAAGLTEYLHEAHGIDFNGILLISPVLDFNTILFGSANNLPYLLFLPSYTAAALHHKKTSGNSSMEKLLAEVEDWVLDNYTTCLARGNSLTSEQKKSYAETISQYTGLSMEYILENNLKIPANRFRKEILRNKKEVIGRMDSRFTGTAIGGAVDKATYDPSLETLIGTFSSAINHYVRNDLGFKLDAPYRYLNYSINRTWDWSSAIHRGQGYVNVSRALTDAMHINKYLNVFVASGYYDLATPYFAAKYTIDHLDLEKTIKNNITIRFYHAGHMMYINRPSLKKLTEDVSLFYKKALGSIENDD